MKRFIIAFVGATLLLTGCAAKNHTSTAVPQTTEVKFLKALDVLATASNALVDPVTNLATAGIITTAQANDILAIDAQVASACKSMADVVTAPGSWESKLPQITALVANIPSISVLTQRYAGMNNVQFQALVTALQGMQSAVWLVAIEAQK